MRRLDVNCIVVGCEIELNVYRYLTRNLNHAYERVNGNPRPAPSGKFPRDEFGHYIAGRRQPCSCTSDALAATQRAKDKVSAAMFRH